jgi:UrcA family protein
MNSNATASKTKPLFYIAAVAACTMLSSPLQAAVHSVAVSVSVSASGLDLSEPADARELYARLQKAARSACKSSSQVGLEFLTNFGDCIEQALGDAVGSINQPQVTLVYLRTHTLAAAASHGIDVPAQLAAR